MSELIYYPLCPQSRFVRILFEEMGVKSSYKEEKLWDQDPGFLAMNPMGLLPVWLIKGAILTGAGPIVNFVIEGGLQPTDEEQSPQFMPQSHLARAEVRRITDWFMVQFYYDVWKSLEGEKLRPLVNQSGTPDVAILRTALSKSKDHLGRLDHLVETRYWLAGEHLTVADMAAASQISCLDFFGDVPWADVPNVKDWYARMKSRPSFRLLLADTIPAYVPPAHYTDLDF